MRNFILAPLIAGSASAAVTREKKDPPADQISTTQHTIRVDSDAVEFNARA